MPKRLAEDPAVPVLSPILPRAVAALGPKGVAAVQRLQETEAQRRALVASLDEGVARARAAGVSWSAIGWAVGTSGEAARQRWGK